MAGSAYIAENLTRKQIDFMLMLDDYELDIFTLTEIKEQLGNQVDEISGLVENLQEFACPMAEDLMENPPQKS